MNYSLFRHRHNFATWAGARAAQRKWKGAKIGKLKAALECSGVVEIVCDQRSWPVTADQFDKLHTQWCLRIKKHLEKVGLENVTYGRVAKLIAVYLKSMIITVHPDSRFASIAHPPIDRILLQNLARSRDPASQYRWWYQTSWTKLTQEKYFKLIASFRDCGLDKPHFWHLERYWTVSDE